MAVKILLKIVRHRKGISIRDLSRKSGVSGAQISYIERGRKRPTIDTLYKLARALNVPITELYLCEDDFATKDQSEKTGD